MEASFGDLSEEVMCEGEKDKFTQFPACENGPAHSKGLPPLGSGSAATCGGPWSAVAQDVLYEDLPPRISGQKRELEVNPHRKADPHSVLHKDKARAGNYGNVLYHRFHRSRFISCHGNSWDWPIRGSMESRLFTICYGLSFVWFWLSHEKGPGET